MIKLSEINEEGMEEEKNGKPDFPWDRMMVTRREFVKKINKMVQGAPYLLKKIKFMKGICYFCIFHVVSTLLPRKKVNEFSKSYSLIYTVNFMMKKNEAIFNIKVEVEVTIFWILVETNFLNFLNIIFLGKLEKELGY